jgi:hypothetical protein
MALYLNTITNEYPRYDGDLELLGWQVGQPLPEGWAEVIPSPEPVPGDGEVVQSQPPVLADGQWYMSWLVREMTPEERVRADNFPKLA